MKLPIAGQSSPKKEERTFAPAHALMRSLVIVTDPVVSIWPFLQGISIPIYRVAEAKKWTKQAVLQPISHHELSGSPAEITTHLQGQKCILLGDWVASWAQVACRIRLTKGQIQSSNQTSVPWDLVLSDARPKVLEDLLQKIL
ncbi:MAG: hypothetical protein ACI9KE_004555 [Polyangiales bacterium]|jgi:hypothetical protein